MHLYFSLTTPFSYFEKDGGYTEIFTEDNVINGIIYSVKPTTKGWINWSCLAYGMENKGGNNEPSKEFS